MKFHLQIWRQQGPKTSGNFKTYTVEQVSADMSFLEMLDLLNQDLVLKGEEPVAFESDCREGICGACGCMINGQAHGPLVETTTCELYMRHFRDGDTIVVEPFRARAFSIVKDLVVERGSLDRIIAAGGYVSVKTGTHADANAILVPKPEADQAMDSSSCIGCGACVAACPNASAALFTGAKISHFAHLPQGRVERVRRVGRMVSQMDEEGFGHCTNIGECHAACPKGISISNIAAMRREYIRAAVCPDAKPSRADD